MKVPFINLGLQYLKFRKRIIKRFDSISKKGDFILGRELEEFEINFASFGDARCYYQYIWDNTKLVQIIVENGDLFNDDELDDCLDDELWSESIENGYFPDKIDKVIENGDCENKVLFNKEL